MSFVTLEFIVFFLLHKLYTLFSFAVMDSLMEDKMTKQEVSILNGAQKSDETEEHKGKNRNI